MKIHCTGACLLALASVAISAHAQPRPNLSATLLKGPAEWRFERLPMPPGFARDLALTGYEEARFAPGVFDTSSPNYLTYVLAVSADGAPRLDAPALQDFLEKYYRGLSVNLGRQKGQSPDPAQMTATVAISPSDPNKFSAKVGFFDSFNDGRKVNLNIEGRILSRAAAGKTFIVLQISPQPKEHDVWKALGDIDSKVDPAN